MEPSLWRRDMVRRPRLIGATEAVRRPTKRQRFFLGAGFFSAIFSERSLRGDSAFSCFFIADVDL
jgi:hypothetical protein